MEQSEQKIDKEKEIIAFYQKHQYGSTTAYNPQSGCFVIFGRAQPNMSLYWFYHLLGKSATEISANHLITDIQPKLKGGEQASDITGTQLICGKSPVDAKTDSIEVLAHVLYGKENSVPTVVSVVRSPLKKHVVLVYSDGSKKTMALSSAKMKY